MKRETAEEQSEGRWVWPVQVKIPYWTPLVHTHLSLLSLLLANIYSEDHIACNTVLQNFTWRRGSATWRLPVVLSSCLLLITLEVTVNCGYDACNTVRHSATFPQRMSFFLYTHTYPDGDRLYLSEPPVTVTWLRVGRPDDRNSICGGIAGFSLCRCLPTSSVAHSEFW